MAKCDNCLHLIWDGEYWDTGHKAYDAWYCDIREEVRENDKFPFIKCSCKHFQMDFWKSEFAKELDGSDESYQTAFKKWEEKYKVTV